MQKKYHNFEILERKNLYKGFSKLVNYQLRHRRFDGSWSPILQREVVLRPEVAGILPYDPVKDHVVLIEQFRVGALEGQNPWLLELIAGYIEPGESPQDMAHREAQEEAGLHLKSLHPICHYWVSPGGSTGRVQLYCAHIEATPTEEIFGVAQEAENIRTRIFTAKQIFDKLSKGEINNSMALIGLQWLNINHHSIKQKFLKHSINNE